MNGSICTVTHSQLVVCPLNVARMKFGLWLFFLVTTLTTCHRPADDLQEAQRRLLAADRWSIHQIAMDEAPVFKEGKHISHISGVRFDRHLDWVKFYPDGGFEGHMTGDDTTQRFQWKVYAHQNVIALRDSATGTGGWNIYPRNVYEDTFEMETRSTVYDPPRVTKLTLRFTILE
jgi:hypothetical protein